MPVLPLAVLLALSLCRVEGAPKAPEPGIAWERNPRPAEGAKGAVALRSGDVLAARTGPVGNGVGVRCFRSRDGGRTWHQAGVIATDPDPQTDIGDGCLRERADGTLLYSYRHNRFHGAHASAPAYAVRVAASRDGGATWRPHSTVMDVRPVGPGPSQGLWSTFLLETRGGALQCYYDDEYTPAQAGFPGHQWLQMRTWDPEARAWARPVTVSRARDPAHLSRDGMGCVVEAGPGRLVCVLESVQTAPPHANVVRVVTSADGGRTWSWRARERGVMWQPADTRFGSYCPWLTRLDGGALLCVFATNVGRDAPDRPGAPVPELNLDVRCVVSRDNGRTWGAPQTIHADTHKAYMPGVVVLRGGPDRGRPLVLWLDTRRGFLSKRGTVTPGRHAPDGL